MPGAKIWSSGTMLCFLSSCKPRGETEAEMRPAKRSLYSGVSGLLER